MGKERLHYYYKDGTEVKAGDLIRFERSAYVFKVYEWENDHYIGLGTDATNPKWIEKGRAVPCEYGIFPFEITDVFYKYEE